MDFLATFILSFYFSLLTIFFIMAKRINLKLNLKLAKCGEVLKITEKGEILQFKGSRHLSFEMKYH